MTGRCGLEPFPDSWFRVASSDDVAQGQMIPIRAFGRDLICFRGDSGRVSVLDAYCAHLGANIGAGGFVDGDNVVCPFHHWRYDGDGRNVMIPYRDKPQRAARLGCLPTIEANGHVLAGPPPPGAAPAWEPPRLPQAESADYVRVEDGEWYI